MHIRIHSFVAQHHEKKVNNHYLYASVCLSVCLSVCVHKMERHRLFISQVVPLMLLLPWPVDAIFAIIRETYLFIYCVAILLERILTSFCGTFYYVFIIWYYAYTVRLILYVRLCVCLSVCLFRWYIVAESLKGSSGFLV